jgi:hypothetical protein
MTDLERLAERVEAGSRIPCCRCSGHGLVTVWSFGVKEPEECSDCGGSGFNWQYPRGAIARYYGGPLIGRTAALRARSAMEGDE